MARAKAPGAGKRAASGGFYSRALSEAERLLFEEASRVEGLDQEISLLRVGFRELAENRPERIDLQLQVARAITAMLRTRYQMSKDQKKSLKAAMARVLQEVAVPLGIGVGMGAGLKAGGS